MISQSQTCLYAILLDSATPTHHPPELKIGKLQPYLQGQPQGMLSNL